MMNRGMRWGYRVAAAAAAGAVTWIALSVQPASSRILHQGVSALLPEDGEQRAATPETESPDSKLPVRSEVTPAAAPSPTRVDAAGFELGMRVEQTLAALDSRRLTGRVVMEYAVVSPSGELSREVTERRSDVIPSRQGRFVTVIRTLPAGSGKDPDPESFRFEFAMPPDENVLLGVTRNARLHDPKAGVLVDKDQFLDAVRAKYGMNPTMSARASRKPGLETLRLEWVFAEQGDCSVDFSRAALGRSEVFRSLGAGESSKSGIASVRNCAASAIIDVELTAAETPLVMTTRTTFANSGKIELNRERHAAHLRGLKHRAYEQRRAELVTAALTSD